MFLETNHETLFPAAPHGRVNCLITPGEVILYIVYLNAIHLKVLLEIVLV